MTELEKLRKLADGHMKMLAEYVIANGPDSSTPCWVAEDENDQIGIIFTPFEGPETKDIVSLGLRYLFKERKVVRYVFSSEIWIRKAKLGEKLEDFDSSVSEHPDREEALTVLAEDRNGNNIMLIKKVHRHADSNRVSLTDDEPQVNEKTKGRFSKMFEPLSDTELKMAREIYEAMLESQQ